MEPLSAGFSPFFRISTGALAALAFGAAPGRAQLMQPIVDYLERGGLVIGLRTASHACQIPKDSAFAKYAHKYDSARPMSAGVQ